MFGYMKTNTNNYCIGLHHVLVICLL